MRSPGGSRIAAGGDPVHPGGEGDAIPLRRRPRRSYDAGVKTLPLLLILGAVGCDRLTAVGGLADPIVAQGVYLGVDAPAGVDLSGADGLDQAALCNVFLAYVADPSELVNAPVEGAVLSLRSDANGTLEFREEEGGKYTLDSSDGLVYEVGDEPSISFTLEEQASRMEVLAPEAPEVHVPATSDIHEAVEVELIGDSYQNVIAAVYDIDRGKLTWDNLPDAVDQVYEFTHTETPLQTLEIPGDAFLRKGLYAVGVAGMKVADPADFEGVNLTLSAFIAGRITPRFLSVSSE